MDVIGGDMYKKILVSNRAGIGDTILTTPVLKALKEKFPASHITFMVSPYAEDLVKGLPFIDEYILYDKKETSMFAMVKALWRTDIALLLDFKYRSAVMAFLALIPVRAGLRHKRGLFMTHAVDKGADWEQNYEPYNYAKVIEESAGIALAGDLTELHVPARDPADIELTTKLLTDNGISGQKPLITIAPFTSWEPKNWGVANFIELIGLLKQNWDCDIILTGTQRDYQRSRELQQLTAAVNLMGQTELPQTIEIIARSRLVVGGCSAPLHIAAATRTAVVGLYGATSPARWAPRKNSIILYRGLACSPCNGPMIGCEAKPCMTDISVNEVFAACNKLL